MNWFSMSLRNKILGLACLASVLVALAAGYGFWTSWSDLKQFEQYRYSTAAESAERHTVGAVQPPAHHAGSLQGVTE